MSTYRLQFDRTGFDLDDANRLVPYLDRLGCSHVYASPLLRARPDSTHGYDVVDPEQIDPAIGGGTALGRLSVTLDEHGMGLILDIVPNHMAFGHHNPWWMDVLAHGPDAAHARHFDLFWDDDELPLPVLGAPYADALASGEIGLVSENDDVFVAYWDERFPLSPGSKRKAGLDATGPALRTALDRLNGDPDELHRLLDAQHYRLVWWQLSRERLAHRRFFTVTELVGIRQELSEVFDDTHRVVARLVGDGIVDGLRIDHVDGLKDPLGYLERLQNSTGGTYVVVEKILAGDEQLPSTWPVAGTTGYDYLDASAKVFVDEGGLGLLASHYRNFTGASLDFDGIVFDQQRFIISERLGPETARFASALEELAGRDRIARDVLPSELISAAIDVIAALPVYRTYAAGGALSPEDVEHVEEAIQIARERAPERDPRVFDFLSEVFLLSHSDELDAQERAGRAAFVERVQQFTGAVMAKGVEDTAFYQFNLLTSLNEVGGHPYPLPEDPVAAFHHHNESIAEHWPHSMTTTSTHDTKRSEDVRARISTISQDAERWISQVEAWHARNRRHRTEGSAPTRSEELLVYQTLLGAWPLAGIEGFEDRLSAYLVKAAREAKVHTAWLEPDLDHERALVGFAAALVHDSEFVDELKESAAPLWRAGALDSLAQLALRLFAPGVPDVYRGQELWDLSLTDPDNRRPVDWERRRRLLDEFDRRHGESGFIEELVESWEDGRIKLAVTATGLRTRRSDPDLFGSGSYLPLHTDGDRADHMIAFARVLDSRWAIAAVPRRTLGLSPGSMWPRDGWTGTTVVLPEGAPVAWTERLTGSTLHTGGAIDAGALFATTPVALLMSMHEDGTET